jgi:hypothetical protein
LNKTTEKFIITTSIIFEVSSLPEVFNGRHKKKMRKKNRQVFSVKNYFQPNDFLLFGDEKIIREKKTKSKKEKIIFLKVWKKTTLSLAFISIIVDTYIF